MMNYNQLHSELSLIDGADSYELDSMSLISRMLTFSPRPEASSPLLNIQLQRPLIVSIRYTVILPYLEKLYLVTNLLVHLYFDICIGSKRR